MAAAWYLREPLFVMDVTQAAAIHVQLYQPDYVSKIETDRGERVSIRPIDIETAHRYIKTMLNFKVVPLVLVLHHGDGAGHFAAVRFEHEIYKSWSEPDANKETMRDRMLTALCILGLPVTPRQLVTKVQAMRVHSEPSDSDYVDDAADDLDVSDDGSSLAPSTDGLSTSSQHLLTEPCQDGADESEPADRVPTGLSQNSDFDVEASRHENTIRAPADSNSASSSRELDYRKQHRRVEPTHLISVGRPVGTSRPQLGSVRRGEANPRRGCRC